MLTVLIYIVCLYADPSKAVDTRSVCLNTSPISEKPKPPDAFQRPNTTLWFHGVMSARNGVIVMNKFMKIKFFFGQTYSFEVVNNSLL